MKRTEQRLQQTIAEYLAWAIPAPTFWTAFPAGGGGELRGKILKGMGLKAGVPDLLIVHEGQALFIELKAPHGVVSEAQRRTLHTIQLAGGRVAICRSLEDVRAALAGWSVPTRETKPIAPIVRALAANLA